MRSVFLAFVLFCGLSEPTLAIHVGLPGEPLDSPPTIMLSSNSVSQGELTIELGNADVTVTTLTSAQAALKIVPLVGANGNIDFSLSEGGISLFGMSARNVSNEAEVITIQAGSFLPQILVPGGRGLLATLDLEITADAFGTFELVLLSFNPAMPPTSSQWLAPGLPPIPMSYENSIAASGGGLLLATFIIAAPEPNSLFTLLGTFWGLASLRRRSQTQLSQRGGL